MQSIGTLYKIVYFRLFPAPILLAVSMQAKLVSWPDHYRMFSSIGISKSSSTVKSRLSNMRLSKRSVGELR